MTPAKYNISLKCILRNKKGEVLILKTLDDSSFFAKYDFPGGRIDEDEFYVNHINILKREILEETGITEVDIKNDVVGIGRHKVLAEERKTVKEDNYLFYLFFEGEINGDESIKISHEHQGFKWIKFDEINLEDYFCSGYLDAVKMYLNK